MSTKSGLLIDFDLLKTVTSTNTKPVAAAILKNGYDVILLHISELNNNTGNLLTVVLAHYTHSCQTNLQPCRRSGRQHLAITTRVK